MIFSYLLNMQSHPSWVCGLKQRFRDSERDSEMSHPSWVCGLKHIIRFCTTLLTRSHPSWVCGLKPISVCLRAYECSHTLRGCVD